MTSFEVGFLCGQIKSKRPEKIAEIGVSAGGTTAVLLNCMNKRSLDAACALNISSFWGNGMTCSASFKEFK